MSAEGLCQGHLTDLFGEISVRMEMSAGWQAEQKIHRTDQSAGKYHRTDQMQKFYF